MAYKTPRPYSNTGTTGQLLTGVTGSDPAFSSSSDGNFSFTSTSGARTLTVSSSDNASSIASAVFAATSGGTSGGDVHTRYAISTTRSFSVGIDNSDSQSFKINFLNAGNVTPSSGSIGMRIDGPTGARTLPINPCVGADLTTGLTNATGDGTFIAPLIFTSDSGSFFDQGANYDTGTGLFTAPVDGKYLVSARVSLENISAGHTEGILRIDKDGSTYSINKFNPAASADSTGIYTAQHTLIVPVSASGTLRVVVYVGGSTKTVGIRGNSFGSFTSLSINLIS